MAAGRLEVDLHVIMGQACDVHRFDLEVAKPRREAQVIARVNETLVPLWAGAISKVLLARSFSLDDAALAYDYFAQRASSAR